jgi:ElaB/YqjD/DUF883 family membrane-anchored ribosome-binding protein
MDNEAAAIRQQMDRTLASLTGKLVDLEHQVSGTVRTVKDSVDTVRDAVDLKLQVRRRPWALVAGAAALGFLGGFRSRASGTGHPARNRKSASAPPARVADAEPHNGANETDAAKLSEAAAPSWLANLGGAFQPEIAALRGFAVGALFEVAREIIAKQAQKPTDPPVGESKNNR